ncbi:aminotransferase class I/II-fold pyridoxal phosphate-dependent enzyme [Nonomuraea deserti]|uniref:cysteine-S-conjugate beta-lyase n=1 Tax=Nonomuraea deserti TaxID=1848322 RepID=A0A4R4W6K7_9ACTN|nr:aminotransferase class I/II-fold pyridoxal phosphate-dependent enzyme [Nonomuraea deserti]TDD11683.1 aminotransferase class I/II-fold pyridoxal phosphate-dependent enzyme [Nonomuraea deserti]
MAEALPLTEMQLRAQISKKWHTYPPDVLPMWLADMDFQPAAAIRSVVLEAAESAQFTYPLDAEHRGVAQTFAARMRARFGWEAGADQVAVIADLVQGLTTSVLAFSEPEDGVIVFSPIYPPFMRSIRVSGRKVVDVPLLEETDGFVIDFDLLEQQAARPDVTLMLLCNPHNPTGRVFTDIELRRVSDIAAEHGIVVVSDEVHADLVYAPHRHTVFATVSAAPTVTLQSATKSFNIAGLRCGVMHFGSEPLHRRFLDVFPDRALGRVSGLAAAATVAAWSGGDEWLGDALETLEANRRQVFQWVSDQHPNVRAHVPEGTYFAWLHFTRIPAGVSTAHDFLLQSARVALQAGQDFGVPYTSWARLNFATSPRILRKALNRMTAALPNPLTGHARSSQPGPPDNGTPQREARTS